VYVSIFYFFFQAEDGIRDADVTGVQTCALPICKLVELHGQKFEDHMKKYAAKMHGDDSSMDLRDFNVKLVDEAWRWVKDASPARSEERRVGKECRSRW